MSDNRKYRDEEWLREQHVNRQRSTYEMSEECGCSRTTIARWLKKYGIEPGVHEVSDGDAKYHEEEWFREQYVNKEKTTGEIAELCGCSGSTIRKWMKKHGIESRSGGIQVDDASYRDEGWLREQYVTQQKTTAGIADECGCSQAVIVKWLRKHGIESRSRGTGDKDGKYRDKGWLREKYIQEQMSTLDIAEECGVCTDTIRRWLINNDIPRREAKPRIENIVTDMRLTDSEWLREKYVKEGMTAEEIVEDLNCSTKPVYYWLNKHGIEARSPGDWDIPDMPTGKDHPKWNGGPAPYGPGWTRSKKRTVRERDNHTCQDPRCSVTQADHLDKYGRKLDVHHLRKARDVDDAEERNAKENLITLCRDCHRRWEKIADAGLVPQVQPGHAD